MRRHQALFRGAEGFSGGIVERFAGAVKMLAKRFTASATTLARSGV
jgi:hypothetical protein